MPKQNGGSSYVESPPAPRTAEPGADRPPIALARRSAARAELAALLLLAVLFVGLAAQRPTDVFWSPDEGGKLLQVQALLGGSARLAIDYPARSLDPDLTLRPYLHSFTRDGEVRLPWPMSWILPNALLYRLLGSPGLLVLPLAGALLAIWSCARLANRVAPGSGWLAAALLGLTSPLLVYGAMPWEHAAAAGAYGLATVLLLEWALDHRGAAPSLLAVGLALGVLCAWRPEGYLFAAVLVAVVASLRPARPRRLLWLAAGAAVVLAPHWTWSWSANSQLLTPSDGFVLPGSPAAPSPADLLARLLAAPIDLLAGAADTNPGAADLLPPAVRWLAMIGLLAAVVAIRASLPRSNWLAAAALVATGAPTALLLVGPPPQAVHGLLAAGPAVAVAAVALARPRSDRWTRALTALAVTSVAALSAALLLFHRLGLAGGELEWGPRFLLPVYLPLLALAAAEICHLLERKPPLLIAASTLLVSLSLLLQLSGLVQIRATERRLTAWAHLLRELPPGPIVVRDAFLPESTAGLTAVVPILCADSPAMLSLAADRLASAGQTDLWYVQFGRLPARWLRDSQVSAVEPLETRIAESLRADRFGVAALRIVLDETADVPLLSTSCPGRHSPPPSGGHRGWAKTVRGSGEARRADVRGWKSRPPRP